ncbi:hypothetical protein GUITHDRAFT_60343, partial [Guillardia theta CCMP2712]
WLSFMRCHLPDSTFKKILARLHLHILPHLHQPLLLADVLTECYSRGGIISVLALHGIFHLIQNNNLEYPEFYIKLYALLEPSIFYVKYRNLETLLRLTEDCLKTPLLPAYVIAAFVKRLARLACWSPTTGASIALPMIYNLLRKHQTCLFLVQSEEENSPPSPHNFTNDPYDVHEPDPSKCKAMQSSLWELQVIER